MRFGPFSRALVNHVLDPIRLAVVTPHGETPLIHEFLSAFEHEHRAKERRQYLPTFPGFARVFGLRLTAQITVELPQHLDAQIEAAQKPHLVLTDELAKALRTLEARRSDFDVVILYLPSRWAPGFYGGEDDDFDLHDHLKAVTAMQGIPLQVVREDRALKYACRASVMWRLSIALYAKAGGVPWKLAEADPDTAFVGLSYALRSEAQGVGKFVTCCSQVFDADGAGLEFIAYETGDFTLERENPFLSRAEMRRVMARSLGLYQRRHGGRSPRRIVVHKTTEFRSEEVSGCLDAFHSCGAVELVQVKQDCGWHGIKIQAKKRPSTYPCDRGSYVPLGGRSVLLWTQGNAAQALGENYYKEGKGIPRPLELVRFAGHGGWEEQCRSVLGLTKMNWNNDGLYDRLPVTLEYAQVLARTIKRIPTLASRPYQFRYFM